VVFAVALGKGKSALLSSCLFGSGKGGGGVDLGNTLLSFCYLRKVNFTVTSEIGVLIYMRLSII
jgi:hypothetical protein